MPVEPLKEPRLIFQLLTHHFSPGLFYRWFSKPSGSVFLTRRRRKALANLFSGINFEVIHIFRLYMVNYAQTFLNDTFSGTYQLDLDDIESLTRHSLSELFRSNGNAKMAFVMECEAKRYEIMERCILPKFDRIFVCSEIDKQKIYQKYHCSRVKVIPNVIRIPKNVPDKTGGAPFTFLFVGTLEYYPNADGIIYFCSEVLPLVRQNTKGDFIVRIIGGGISKKFAKKLLQVPEVELIGYIQEVEQYYHQSNAVIVPIRAGGGTRIKILEAFSYRRPVISTYFGVEGLEAQKEVHLLAANTKEDFARHCIRIMSNHKLRNKLTKNAYSLVQDKYNFDKLNARLRT
jgi:glycosyltransferase involved in cell wall biosynthesis